MEITDGLSTVSLSHIRYPHASHLIIRFDMGLVMMWWMWMMMWWWCDETEHNKWWKTGRLWSQCVRIGMLKPSISVIKILHVILGSCGRRLAWRRHISCLKNICLIHFRCLIGHPSYSYESSLHFLKYVWFVIPAKAGIYRIVSKYDLPGLIEKLPQPLNHLTRSEV